MGTLKRDKMSLKEAGKYLDIVMDELNVKGINVNVAETEKGLLEMVYDGEEFRFVMGGEDVTTARLLKQVAPSIAAGVFADDYRRKETA